MKITFLTLFPEIFDPVLKASILGRAQTKGLVEYQIINIRQFGDGSHKTVDDTPYGGGVGMILKPDVLTAALKSIDTTSARVVLTSASGTPYTQKKAKEYSRLKHLVIICGHYEGVDQRFVDHYVDEEISIGDYVLTGGELPAMVMADSVIRLIKGVLEKAEATQKESYENNLLEHPHYTRPVEFEGEKVPAVLISGNHQKIAEWRHQAAILKTRKNRPDMLS